MNPALVNTPVPAKVNTGLSNIVTRSARLDPRWVVNPDPNNKRGVKRLDPAHSTATDNDNALWIDRARVFQTEMSALTRDYGTVDSSINDVNPEPGTLGKFARRLTADPNRNFINPFLSDTAGALGSKSIGLSHPLGGCRMADGFRRGGDDMRSANVLGATASRSTGHGEI
jgi:hypothetical protein